MRYCCCRCLLHNMCTTRQHFCRELSQGCSLVRFAGGRPHGEAKRSDTRDFGQGGGSCPGKSPVQTGHGFLLGPKRAGLVLPKVVYPVYSCSFSVGSRELSRSLSLVQGAIWCRRNRRRRKETKAERGAGFGGQQPLSGCWRCLTPAILPVCFLLARVSF